VLQRLEYSICRSLWPCRMDTGVCRCLWVVEATRQSHKRMEIRDVERIGSAISRKFTCRQHAQGGLSYELTNDAEGYYRSTDFWKAVLRQQLTRNESPDQICQALSTAFGRRMMSYSEIVIGTHVNRPLWTSGSRF
jgi:hypothetical protein